jgi:hypothetical protein
MHDCSRQQPPQRQLHQADISIILSKEIWRRRRSSHFRRLPSSHWCPPPSSSIHNHQFCRLWDNRMQCGIKIVTRTNLSRSLKHKVLYIFCVELHCRRHSVCRVYAWHSDDSTVLYFTVWVARISSLRVHFASYAFQLFSRQIHHASNLTVHWDQEVISSAWPFLFCSESTAKWVRGGTKAL